MNEGAGILAIGDIHLGTACSGLPDDMAALGLDPKELTPAAALKLAVDFALAEKVDAVLFAGDVVESTNARFEAMPALEAGVRRLVEAGIAVVAVAGNHDVEALPRLAALIDGFTLLGAGGQWETRMITRDGAALAEIIGWSFGERFVRESPLAGLLAAPWESAQAALPRIGLLHADLDASGGHYAPVRRAELENANFSAWLLGHIHKPSLEALAAAAPARPIGYLGSLIALDPSETGPHGPWLMKIPAAGGIELRQVPLAPLRWEVMEISVEGLDDVEDLPDRIMHQAAGLVGRLGENAAAPTALGLRVRLTGATGHYAEIRRRMATSDWRSGLVRSVHGTAVFVSRISDAMSLRIDLGEIAAGDDPAALLARRLRLLEEGGEGSRALLQKARAKLQNVTQEERWAPLQDHRHAQDPLSDGALREILMRAGRAALNAMLSPDDPS